MIKDTDVSMDLRPTVVLFDNIMEKGNILQIRHLVKLLGPLTHPALLGGYAACSVLASATAR